MATLVQLTHFRDELHSKYMQFSMESPTVFGQWEVGDRAGHRSLSMHQIGMTDDSGARDFVAYIIDKSYEGRHSADQDPHFAIIDTEQALNVSDVVFARIRDTFPSQDFPQVPVQGVYHFREVATIPADRGNINQLLAGTRETIYTNRFEVRRIIGIKNGESLSFKIPNSPLELWTHGRRPQALTATIRELTQKVKTSVDPEKSSIIMRLKTLIGAQSRQINYDRCLKQNNSSGYSEKVRLEAQTKKLQLIDQSHLLNEDEREIKRAKVLREIENCQELILRYQEEQELAQSNLDSYIAQHFSDLPHSAREATYQIGFSVKRGPLTYTKQISATGNVLTNENPEVFSQRFNARVVSTSNNGHVPYKRS